MSLFNIKDKLYKKEQEENLAQHEITQYNPEASETGVNTPHEKDLWMEKSVGLGQAEKGKITKGLLALIVVLAMVLLLAVAFEIRQAAFNVKNSSVSIRGSEQSESGQAVTYEIDYKNDNWIGMRNAVIKVSYPEEFKPAANENFKEEGPTSGVYSLGSVALRSSGKVFLTGKAYSPKGALIYLRASLDYQPAFFFGQFETKNQLGVNIIPAPITLEIQGPQDIVKGNALDYLINYRNNSTETLDGLQLQMQYPEGFKFFDAVPTESSDGNTWKIGSLKPGEAGKVVISGQLDSESGMTRLATVSMGVMDKGEFVSYNDETVATRIMTSPLLIAQTINYKKQLSVDAGEHLEFRINYKNNGNLGLRDVIVTEKLDSPVLDYTTLDMQGGSFDASNNLITWKASDIPAFNNLAPGTSGDIVFSIGVKNNIPLDGEQKKNFIVTSLAKIDSPDVSTPIAMNKIVSSNRLDMKLNSKIILETRGFYHDATITNSGPIPPKVGQETTYTLHWKAMNVSNDINNVTVTASLPTNATMTGKIFPDDARLSYNERTNSVVWNIGKMDAGEGVLSAPLEVAFQVKIKPSPEQAGREVGLLGQATLGAKDLFTLEDLSVSSEAKTINLPEDAATINVGGSRVSK